MLTGMAAHIDQDRTPEQRRDIVSALLNRAILKEKDRAFLKSLGWL